MKGKRHSALVLVALLLISLGGTTVARAEATGPEYLVQPGDTLYTIAARFGTTVQALQAANRIADPATILVGQVLVLPGFEGVTGRLTTHTVEFGDTLGSLGLRLGVSPETLIRLNRLVNPSGLYLGEAVIYPEGSTETLKLPSAQTHTTAPGETLFGLAARFRANPSLVAVANVLPAGHVLLPGQSLVIPGLGIAPPTALPAPLASLSVSPLPAAQGRTLRLKALLEGDGKLSGTLDFRPLRFVDEGEAWYALQGIDAEAEPGTYPLTVTVALPSGGTVSFTQRLPVRHVDYGRQILPPVDPLTLDPSVADPELAHVKSFTAQFTPTRYWQAAFALPFGGPITSPFGIRRAYNNGQLVSSHTGIDFGGPPGAPIYAAAPGAVVMAEALAVRGNATLIDHGWGVYTGYWHQSEIGVKVGDVVQAGQQIGRLGSTGRVTGPNLHWELWVGGVPVDPLEWTGASYP